MAPISSIRKERRAFISAPTGLFSGGTQRTALVIRQFSVQSRHSVWRRSFRSNPNSNIVG